MAPARKQTSQERLLKKREAEKKRQEKIRSDVVLREREKEKNRQKYLNRIKKGQVLPICQQSARQKRVTRKRNRTNVRTFREKAKTAASISKDTVSPPPSTPGLLAPMSSRKVSGRKKVRKDRASAYRNLKRKETELKKMTRLCEKYKKKYYRLQGKTSQLNTPRSATRKMLRGMTVSSAVRKQLFIGNVLSAQLLHTYNQLKNNQKQRQIYHKIVSGKVLKKYRCLSKFKNIFKGRCLQNTNQDLLSYQRKKRSTPQGPRVRTQVEGFLSLDLNSRLCPGKRDTVTRNGIKVQKRYLNETMKNLHQAFLKSHWYCISYSLFCKFRPFWVVSPKADNRDTCLCVTHANMKLLVERMSMMKLMDSISPQEILKELCCPGSPTNEKCLLRQCEDCNSNIITYNEFVDEPATYKQWITKKEERLLKNGKIAMVQLTVKEDVSTTTFQLIEQLEKTIVKYMTHVAYIRHQYLALDQLKDELKDNAALVHIDFSENYSCKYASEVQSVHFGASRDQVTLHTGVCYSVSNGVKETMSFCSLSADLRHDPSSIWAHLLPLLTDLTEKLPALNTLHFLSDSPCTQYRNKKMFYTVAQHLNKFFPQISEVSWNYSEAGHGKGAPDGIGAVLKRTADRVVAQGQDINTFSRLYEVLERNCTGIQLYKVNTEMIENIDKIFAGITLQSFVGTMKVHQVSWCDGHPEVLSMRYLSCFTCLPGTNCHHYSIGDLWKPCKVRVAPAVNEEEEDDEEEEEDEEEDVADSAPEEEHQSLDANLMQKGEWVVIQYDGQLYPGEILEITNNQLSVSTMVPSIGKNTFKWPNKKDVLLYGMEDVMRKISPPIPCGSRAAQFKFEHFP